MSADGLSDPQVKSVLETTRRIALVGASNKSARASYGVMRFLLNQGFDVVAVNPGLAGQELFGRKVVGALEDAGPLDMVDLFRNARDVAQPVAEAIRLGAKTIWMQLGIVNDEVADQARHAGLTVVMDRCPAIEMPRLGILRK